MIHLYINTPPMILLEKFMDWTMWTDEASGAYMAYSSIAEKRTSFRRKSNAKLLYHGYNKCFPIIIKRNLNHTILSVILSENYSLIISINAKFLTLTIFKS